MDMLNLPKQACERLATTDLGPSLRHMAITSNGGYSIGQPLTRRQVTAWCCGNDSILWIFG